MEDNVSKRSCAPLPLPLSALRLLVPPIRLASAAIWQIVQQKVVADYGMLEEFVATVTDIVPELLTSRQRAQLILGLRARLILQLCQFEANADSALVQPHLDRVQTLIEAWPMEVGATGVEAPHSFADLVKKLLKNPDEREHFFQNVFPQEFGPTYDEALHALMWVFLSRLEKFLPLQTFQEVASMFGDVSSALEESVASVSRCQELRTLLQYRKDLSQLDHNDASLDALCIVTALKLPSVERAETDETEPRATTLANVPSRTSEWEKDSLTLSRAAQVRADAAAGDRTSGAAVDGASGTPGGNGAAAEALRGDVPRHEAKVGLKSQAEDPASRRLKRCRVGLRGTDAPSSRPARPNRGLRMKRLLLEEKRGLREETLPAHKSDSAPVSNCSEDDSWSYYSDEGSRHGTPSVSDSWSDCSGDGSSFGTPVRSYAEEKSSSSCSNVDPPKKAPSASRRRGVTCTRASAPRRPRNAQCFICQQRANTSLRAHMRTHFPTADYACPRCDSRFKLFSSFQLHVSRTCFEYGQQQVDPERPDEAERFHRCATCDETFRYKVSRDRHELTHNELYCGVCRKVLRDAATLARHAASHTQFQCNRCEETFAHFKPLLRHCENVHKIRRPFRCDRCAKTLPGLRVLITHEWTHTGRLPFQCAQCGLRFRTDADLLSHGRVHTRERPYLCADCGKTFSHKSNLLRHLHLVHGASQGEKRHACSECEKSFKEKGALKKHQRSTHLKELFRHPCPYCGKMVSASTIARHRLIHTGERPFRCTAAECDKRFRSTSEVKRHVLIHHTTERPYRCDVCGKGFIKMCFLNAHAKTHSGEKPFVCQLCGKAFPKLYSAQRHKKLVHTFGASKLELNS